MGERHRVTTLSYIPNSYIVVRLAPLCISSQVNHLSGEQKKLFAVLAITVLVAVAAFGAIMVMVPNVPNLDPVPGVLLIGADATVENVTLTEMTEMSTITKNGSYQNSYGNVRGVGVYTGVLISDLVELVGGMQDDDSVKIIASDGYSQTFEYSKVFPNASIWGIQGDMILAYEFNGTIVPELEKGFHLMFLTEDGYYSNADANATTDPDPYAAGPQLVSNVTEIRVLREPVEPAALVVDVDESIVEYTLSEVMGMPSITGEGGYRRSTGTISGPYTVTGVGVFALIQQVATLPANYTLTAYSSDRWNTQYTKAEVEGTQSGYTPAGDPLDEIHSTMILAYEFDGSLVDADDGPLRMVFINEDGNLTDGSLWAKLVVNLTITEVPLTGLMVEENSAVVINDSLLELQLCGQSKLFTYIFVRRF